jgi:hypothetical protein
MLMWRWGHALLILVVILQEPGWAGHRRGSSIVVLFTADAGWELMMDRLWRFI